MQRMLYVLLCMLCSMPAVAYKLVHENDEAPFKWGSAQVGTGVTIRYALARSRFTLAGGFSRAACDTIDSLHSMLEKSGVDESSFVREIQRGINQWSRVADVRFVYTGDADSADVIIGAQVDPQGTAFANVEAVSSEPMRVAHKAIVCINPLRDLVEKRGDCKTRFNIAYLMSHEFGHVLGLDHPAPSGSLMAFRCSEEQQLTNDDAAGAQYLYGKAK